MNVSEFVVKVANPYFVPADDFSNITDEFLRSSINFAVKNKVFPLFYEGCLKLGISVPKEAELLMNGYEKRRRMQMDAVNLLLDISDELNIELLFFKTFKPFIYIPDDIDVLLRNKNDLKFLISKLKEKGYFILKIGTPEVVLRKIEENGVYVDLDIHKRLAVGHLDLFRVENLWQKQALEMFKLDDGRMVAKLSEDYEVVREAAYSLLKDFNLSIPGLYLAIHALMKRDLEVIERIAAKENLLLPLYLYLDTAFFITRKMFNSETILHLRFNRPFTSMLPLRITRSQLYRRVKVPYQYPVPLITLAYLSKAWLEISRNRNLRVISQILRQPSSKGIGILLDYFREFLHEKCKL
jgi:hypothetical protein